MNKLICVLALFGAIHLVVDVLGVAFIMCMAKNAIDYDEREQNE